MRSAAQAYGAIAKQVASPRELEASLLLKAASKLQAVHDRWDDSRTQLAEALLYNRKLWTIFVTSITAPEHPLPTELRQNVATLGLFVLNHTISVLSNPRAGRLVPLIAINREVAAGLRGRA
jgi:flagellar biosynthesis activator protein FlaF